ncbi:MAG: hypothetical protein HKO72_09870 [Flavobacteriaceae bacterium]|nr:hypothetical protein [Bacteroidia bacterium]NNL61624.1 hypothetical protein [Flavobacteriaceae bacterium]
MKNNAIILTLAYPDTIVMVADEWYSPYLRYLGIGKKDYVRAGHAALVLIHKETGILEYHDFGRYITPEPNGRVRGKTTDNELDFSLNADIKDGEIHNLDEILSFLGTNPKLTHGDGKLIASICDEIDYDKARSHITRMQKRGFIRYAAFIKDGCNCARFVTDSLIASVTNMKIKNKLKKSKTFTPSTVGNVLLANTGNEVYEVNEHGAISVFKGSVLKENIRCFLDRLKDHQPNYIGTLEPKPVEGLHDTAQWLSGIAAGAWFELHKNGSNSSYRFRRISPYGNIDVDAIFFIDDNSFNYHEEFEFIQYSNCNFFHIKQKELIFRFERNMI